jgi:hypothetical protein
MGGGEECGVVSLSLGFRRLGFDFTEKPACTRRAA